MISQNRYLVNLVSNKANHVWREEPKDESLKWPKGQYMSV